MVAKGQPVPAVPIRRCLWMEFLPPTCARVHSIYVALWINGAVIMMTENAS